ncbi:glycerate kinase type-2 family protein [Halomarina oriensis]|uniref:DUF4147 domain-containing protein n=1 Tax=Halomarina oriensis TaxID=671145 RepID=A0A6B0GN21_9EURY|nr:DUF4147 domain-containing protein [Halomarina oriensis]MWG35017.1 DUF4147 domain-containing protein [Halomarina oriensis]
MGSPQETAVECFQAAVAETLPVNVVAECLSMDGDVLSVDESRYDLSEYDEIVVVGSGKATPGVADALADRLGDRLSRGLVVGSIGGESDRIEYVIGEHPVPNEAGLDAGRRIHELVSAADEETLVLAVITGGASALLVAPPPDVDLDALRETTDLLLRSGATVTEINVVRKHLSLVKGGWLARAASPATLVGIVFSDVVGDDPSVIGSGPTAPDASTYGDALDVLDRYDLAVPSSVQAVLSAGATGDRPETPTADAPAFETAQTHVLVTGRTGLDAAAAVARDRGYEPLVLSGSVRGEAREAASTQAAIAEELVTTGDPVTPPAVVLSGGETTVTVQGTGEGGPNLECALAVGIELAETTAPVTGRVAFLAADTDGNDGSTDAAGGLVGPGTLSDLQTSRAALANNDALSALSEASALVSTGPTGTNVNDFRAIVVEAADGDCSVDE